ncbi:MAG: hypothetical protein B7C24_12335 [Bacteroidetes bacterium 4572_77]|nr:MAG: hypothetical protein B7C24_12335 [Bacteroidetes bacterium 4572_77]
MATVSAIAKDSIITEPKKIKVNTKVKHKNRPTQMQFAKLLGIETKGKTKTDISFAIHAAYAVIKDKNETKALWEQWNAGVTVYNKSESIVKPKAKTEKVSIRITKEEQIKTLLTQVIALL